MKNLFSVLTPEQINGLSQEERNTLTELDKKLFPNLEDDDQKHNEWLKNKLAKMKAEEEESAKYAKELEDSFV